jgi:hypothetical protein
MTQTLWGETRRRRRRRRRNPKQRTAAPYSITGTGNDCEVLGHTLNTFDLAGCTTCIDCGVKIFCPQCIQSHPNDPQAVALLCPLHESQVNDAV